jgi:hypothetical protein
VAFRQYFNPLPENQTALAQRRALPPVGDAGPDAMARVPLRQPSDPPVRGRKTNPAAV